MIAQSTFWSKKTLTNDGYTIELYPNNVPPYQLFIDGNVQTGYVIFDILGSTCIYAGDWSNSQSYSKYDVVKYDNKLWIGIRGSLGNTPSEASEYWALLKPVSYEANVVDEILITKVIDSNLIYDVNIEKTYDEKNLGLGFPKMDNLKFKFNYSEIINSIFDSSGITGQYNEFNWKFYYLVLLNALINPTINLTTALTNYKGLDLSIDYTILYNPTSEPKWKDAHRIQNKYLGNVYSVKKNENIEPFNEYLLNLSVQNNRYELDMDIFNTEKILDIETESMVSYLFKMLSWEQLELLSFIEGDKYIDGIGTLRKFNKHTGSAIYRLDKTFTELTTTINNHYEILQRLSFPKEENILPQAVEINTYDFYVQIWRKFYTLLLKYFMPFKNNGTLYTDDDIRTYIDPIFPFVTPTNFAKLTPYGYHEYYLPLCYTDRTVNEEVLTKSSTTKSFYELYFSIEHRTAINLSDLVFNFKDTSLGKYLNIYQFLNQEYINNSCIFRYSWQYFPYSPSNPTQLDYLSLFKQFNPILNLEGIYDQNGNLEDAWIVDDIFENLLNIEDIEQPKFTYRTNITKGVNNSQIGSTNNDIPEYKNYSVTDKTIESTFIYSLKDNYFTTNTSIENMVIDLKAINETNSITNIIKMDNFGTTVPYLYTYYEDLVVKVAEDVLMFGWGSGSQQFQITNNLTTGLKGYGIDNISCPIGNYSLIRPTFGNIEKTKETLVNIFKLNQRNSLIKTQANFLFDNFKTIKNSIIEGKIPNLTKSEYYPIYTGSYGYFVDYTNTPNIPTQIQQFLNLQNNYIIFLSCKLNLENGEADNQYLILTK